MKWTLAVAAIAFLGGMLFMYVTRPDPIVPVQRVEVPRAAIELAAPKVELGWLERWAWSALELEQRRLARGGARSEVAEFCRPLVDVARSGADPDTVPILELAPRSALAVITAGRIGGGRGELFGWTNAGDLYHDIHGGLGGVHGTIEFGAAADSTWMRRSRGWWVRPVLYGSAIFGAGYIAGKVTP